MIEQAENLLRDLGFYDVRVRHHELPMPERREPIGTAGQAGTSSSGLPGRHLARIEVGVGELPKFLENGLSEKVANALKEIGYAHVTLDLQGYRRGSTNEAIKASTLQEHNLEPI